MYKQHDICIKENNMIVLLVNSLKLFSLSLSLSLSLSSTIDHSHTFTSSRGVRFTPANKRTGEGTGDPHGMPCIREVLRFLIAIINPRDK